jgi:ketosteroid isomerase-like protein
VILEKYHVLTGKPYEEIARLVGKSPAFVSQHVSMIRLFSDVCLPEEEKTSLAHSLTERHARLLLKIENSIERWNTAKLVVRANLCVRELQKILPRPSRKKRESSSDILLRSLILRIISGMNNADLRPLLEARSKHDFSLFDDFPPFFKMRRDEAEEHVVNVSKRIQQSRITAEDLEVKVRGDLAYATMYVSSFVALSDEVKRIRSRVTMIFSKEQNWKIVHEHWSRIDPGDLVNYSFTTEEKVKVARKFGPGFLNSPSTVLTSSNFSIARSR